jgi:hypothetical protein
MGALLFCYCNKYQMLSYSFSVILADPLMADIAQEFQSNYSKFEATAREWTLKFATQVKKTSQLSGVNFANIFCAKA